MTTTGLRWIMLGLMVCASALTGCSNSDAGETSVTTRVVAVTTTTDPRSSSIDGVDSVTEEPSAFEDWETASTFDPAETIAADEPVRGPATTIPTGTGPRPAGYTGFLGNLGLDEVVASPAAAPDPVAAPGTAPLTGLPGTVPIRPAVVAKIDNSPPARPQRGLNAADIVFEEQVEGGVTRFAAVFHSQMAIVGPVRSTRTTDISFVNAFGGPALLYSGANRIVDAILMRQETIQNYSAARSSGYWRDSARRVPHNLFTDSANFVHRGSSPPAQFAYRQPRTSLQTAQTTTSTTSASTTSTSSQSTTTSASSSTSTTLGPTTSQTTSPSTTITATTIPTTVTRPPTPSQVANVLSATLGQTRVRWDWNGSSWLRTQNGTVHKTDGGAQVSATNVVVAVVTEAATGMTDSVGSPVPEFVFVGTGPVSVFSEGRRIDGTWTRPTLRSPAVLTDANGSVIELTPGRTWVELVVAGTYQSS